MFPLLRGHMLYMLNSCTVVPVSNVPESFRPSVFAIMKFLASSTYFIYAFSAFLLGVNACSPKTVNYPSDNACRAGCAAEVR